MTQIHNNKSELLFSNKNPGLGGDQQHKHLNWASDSDEAEALAEAELQQQLEEAEREAAEAELRQKLEEAEREAAEAEAEAEAKRKAAAHEGRMEELRLKLAAAQQRIRDANKPTNTSQKVVENTPSPWLDAAMVDPVPVPVPEQTGPAQEQAPEPVDVAVAAVRKHEQCSFYKDDGQRCTNKKAPKAPVCPIHQRICIHGIGCNNTECGFGHVCWSCEGPLKRGINEKLVCDNACGLPCSFNGCNNPRHQKGTLCVEHALPCKHDGAPILKYSKCKFRGNCKFAHCCRGINGEGCTQPNTRSVTWRENVPLCEKCSQQ